MEARKRSSKCTVEVCDRKLLLMSRKEVVEKGEVVVGLLYQLKVFLSVSYQLQTSTIHERLLMDEG